MNPTTLNYTSLPSFCELRHKIRHKGMLIIDSFPMLTKESFADFLFELWGPLASYVGGGSPRTALGKNIYTSTEYAAQAHIPLHLELSYRHRAPELISFACIEEPITGGATTIGDLRELPNKINEKTIEAFERKGLRYQTCLHSGNGFGKSWQDVFATNNKDEAKLKALSIGAQVEWLDDDHLLVQYQTATWSDYLINNKKIWINQCLSWHPWHLGETQARKLFRLFKDRRYLPKHATFADGEEIPDALLNDLAQAQQRITLAPKWKSGSILLLDNRRVAHGREPFVGKRVVLVGMGNFPELA